MSIDRKLVLYELMSLRHIANGEMLVNGWSWNFGHHWLWHSQSL